MPRGDVLGCSCMRKEPSSDVLFGILVLGGGDVTIVWLKTAFRTIFLGILYC